jgi:PAS domain S-box-containing protein
MQSLAEELDESRVRARAMLESALDCIINLDQKGRIVEFNPAAEKTFG